MDFRIFKSKDEDNTGKKQVTQKQTTSPQFQGYAQPVSQAVFPPIPLNTVMDNEPIDQTYLDHLYKFMQDQNIPGPDYFEFANTLHEMGQMANGLPETNLYQLAYVGLKAQGVTPEQLVQTANKYIISFEKHKTEFENYLSQEGSSQITAKTQEIQNLEQSNKSAETKISELTQQISVLQQQMVANAQKINENQTFIQSENIKITNKKTKFERAYKVVVDKISSDIQKITNYIK